MPPATRAALGLLLLTLAGACVAQRPSPVTFSKLHPHRAVSALLPLETQQSLFAPDAAAPVVVPTIAGPGEIACEFRSHGADADAAYPLTFDPARRPFAIVEGADRAVVKIPVGEAKQGAWVELELDNAVLWGRVDAARLTLLAAHPGILAGVVLLDPGTKLTFLRAEAGKVTVSIAPDPKVRLLRQAPQATLACSDLAIGDVEFEPLDAVLARDAPRPDVVAIAQKKGWLQLSANPRGPAVASVEVTAAPDEAATAQVLEERQGWVRVIVGSESTQLIGWVPRAALRIGLEAALLGLIGTGGDPNAPTAPWGSDDGSRQGEMDATCAWNGVLIAEQDGQKRSVGRLVSGHPLITGEMRGPYRVIEKLDDVKPGEGTAWMTTESELYRCRAPSKLTAP